jgi:hypothetical protein
MRGWRNAFRALGATFRVANPKDSGFRDFISDNVYDIVMGYSGVGLENLPLKLLNSRNTALVINGLPFNSSYSSPDIQAPCANPMEVDFISKFNKKIVWSQWSPIYLNTYYSGYISAGISVLCLPYAGDILTNVIEPRDLGATQSKILFVGNLAHRRRGNMSLIRKLMKLVSPEHLKIYGGDDWKALTGLETKPTPPNTDINDLYRSSLICPNIHTARQKRRAIQLNDRTFNIAAAGAFQICDNPLVVDYYSNDEIVYADNDIEYIEKVEFFLRHPELTKPFTAAALRRTYRDHSYFNRIAALYEGLGICDYVGIGDECWKPFRVSTDSRPNITLSQHAQYAVETRFMAAGRYFKKRLFKY